MRTIILAALALAVSAPTAMATPSKRVESTYRFAVLALPAVDAAGADAATRAGKEFDAVVRRLAHGRKGAVVQGFGLVLRPGEPSTVSFGKSLSYETGFSVGPDGRKALPKAKVALGTKLLVRLAPSGKTLDIRSENVRLVEMVTLDAGPALGTLSQPHTETNGMRTRIDARDHAVHALPVGHDDEGRDLVLVIARGA